jgi:hypothetical protein
VILASSGQAVGLHVAGRDAGRIADIARFIQSRDWGGALFSAERAAGEPRGVVDGTFSLALAHMAAPERAPDLLVTFPWTSGPNRFGVTGTDLACTSGGARLYASDHGGVGPWNIRNTLFAWGPHVKKDVTIGTPAGNVDVAPTILALLGIDGVDAMDGRPLAEALVGGPDPEHLPVETRTHAVEAGAYRAALQLSTIAGRAYIDKAWRVR